MLPSSTFSQWSTFSFLENVLCTCFIKRRGNDPQKYSSTKKQETDQHAKCLVDRKHGERRQERKKKREIRTATPHSSNHIRSFELSLLKPQYIRQIVGIRRGNRALFLACYCIPNFPDVISWNSICVKKNSWNSMVFV